MEGQVRDVDGKPVAGAVVDVWHANTKGGYSFFDPSQAKYNLRRRIETDGEGRYSSAPSCPRATPARRTAPTQALLDQLGRHGNRPAHIHFFVSAPGYRKLTTQINIDGDEYLHDDFAFATRDELIPPVEKVERRRAHPGERAERSLHRDHLRLRAAPPRSPRLPATEVHREHAPAA